MSIGHCAEHNWYKPRLTANPRQFATCPFCEIATLTTTITKQQEDMRVLAEAIINIDEYLDWECLTAAEYHGYSPNEYKTACVIARKVIEGRS